LEERRGNSPPPPKLPYFYGEPGEWSSFIFSFDTTAGRYGWSDHKKLIRLKECLRKQAVDFVKERPKRDREDFKRLLKCLERRYGVVHDPFEEQKNLAIINQNPDESLEDFAERVTRTAARAYKGIPEAQLQKIALPFFIQGVKDKLASFLSTSHDRPKTIPKALKRIKASVAAQRAIWGRTMNLASRQVSFAPGMDNLEMDVRSVRPLRNPGTPPTRDVRSGNGPAISTRAETPALNPPPSLPKPQTDSPSRKEFDQLKNLVEQLIPQVTSMSGTNSSPISPKKSIRCYDCNGLGHIARDCHLRKQSPSPRSQFRQRECYKCHKVGHFAKDCTEGEEDVSPSRSNGTLNSRRVSLMAKDSPSDLE
jgi:hypothetical protein